MIPLEVMGSDVMIWARDHKHAALEYGGHVYGG